MKCWHSQSKKVKHLLTVSVVAAVALTTSSCCTTGAPVLKPPACPVWQSDAVGDLEMLLYMQEVGDIEIVDLEYQLGEQQRHCEALDAFLEDVE